MMSSYLACIGRLPPEMLAHVFTFLDAPGPSDTRLHDQPGESMLGAPGTLCLKAVSTVSWQWRAAALPLLFRHVALAVGHGELLAASDDRGPASILSCLEFLRSNRLQNYVRAVTLVVADRTPGIHGPPEGDSPHGPELAPGENYNWLWSLLFDRLDPLRFTILASPRVLASLFSRTLLLGDAWSFRMPCHIVSLSCERRHSAEPGRVAGAGARADPTAGYDASSPATPTAPARFARNPRRISCELFTIRPWTSLLLNEGSSTRVYATYEFFLRRPPSMLGALLGSEEFPNDVGLLPSTVRNFSYVGIFPLSSHFNTLVQHLPHLDRLFVQLVPRNDILDSRDEMRNIDRSDLWMECNTSYSLLMRELLQRHPRGNWCYLREFESGDVADRDTWHMIERHVGLGWKVEREGVLVRR